VALSHYHKQKLLLGVDRFNLGGCERVRRSSWPEQPRSRWPLKSPPAVWLVSASSSWSGHLAPATGTR